MVHVRRVRPTIVMMEIPVQSMVVWVWKAAHIRRWKMEFPVRMAMHAPCSARAKAGYAPEVSGRSAMMTIRARTIGATHRVGVCIIPIRFCVKMNWNAPRTPCVWRENAFPGQHSIAMIRIPVPSTSASKGSGASIQPLPRKRAKMDWHAMARIHASWGSASVNRAPVYSVRIVVRGHCAGMPPTV